MVIRRGGIPLGMTGDDAFYKIKLRFPNTGRRYSLQRGTLPGAPVNDRVPGPTTGPTDFECLRRSLGMFILTTRPDDYSDQPDLYPLG